MRTVSDMHTYHITNSLLGAAEVMINIGSEMGENEQGVF